MTDPEEKDEFFLPERVTLFEADDEEREVTQNRLNPETLMEILCISLKPFANFKLTTEKRKT